MVELLIIADDLTGAIDTGVQFAKQGICTKVIHNPDSDLNKILDEMDCTVIVFNTESRHVFPQEAARRVAKVVKTAKEKGIKRFYKKTDSTMRGNIGAELEAFKEETGQDSIPFIPAHPKLKRFTKDGYHYIGEQLLHETEFGNDPLEPIKISFLPALLQKQTSLEVKLISTSGYDIIPKNKGILVFDCKSEKELEKIGLELLRNNLQNSIAGTAAMCELLPILFDLKSEMAELPKLHEPTLLVNGSLNNISQNQIRFAHERGTKIITIPAILLSNSNFKSSPYFSQILKEVQGEIEAGRNVILSSTDIQKEPNKKIYNEADYNYVSNQIGSIVAMIFNELQFISLFVIGGDTLTGIMNSLNCDFIAPKTEVLPGVGFSIATFKKNNIHILTKPGGYGDKNVIVQVFNVIKESNQ